MSQYPNQQPSAPGQYPPYQQPPQGQPPFQYPQQPGFPPPAWQQPMHQQYPPQYAPPPPQPPQRKKGWIRRHPIWSMLIALLVLSSIVGAINDLTAGTTAATNNTGASPTAAPAIQPTPSPATQLTPTIQPTAKIQQIATPQPSPATGDAVLGAPIGTFIARFGQPKQMGTGYYSFQNDSIEANFTSDNDKRTFAVSRNAPNNQEFTLQDGKAACVPFLPADATYTGKHMTQFNPDGSLRDEQYVYVSPLLGKDMPANIFTDEKGNNTTPGTIGLVLTYDSTIQNNTTQFLSCDDEAGLESS